MRIVKSRSPELSLVDFNGKTAVKQTQDCMAEANIGADSIPANPMMTWF